MLYSEKLVVKLNSTKDKTPNKIYKMFKKLIYKTAKKLLKNRTQQNRHTLVEYKCKKYHKREEKRLKKWLTTNVSDDRRNYKSFRGTVQMQVSTTKNKYSKKICVRVTILQLIENQL